MEKIEIKQKLLETIQALFPDSEVETDVLEYADLIDDFKTIHRQVQNIRNVQVIPLLNETQLIMEKAAFQANT